MKQGKIEFPPKPQPEHIQLLIELMAAIQKIPQRYCMLCRAKTTTLGIDGHNPACPLRRAHNLIQAAQKD